LGALYANPGALDLAAIDSHRLDNVLLVSLYSFGGVLGSTFLNSSDFKQIFRSGAGWPSEADRRRLGSLLEAERLVGNAATSLVSVRWTSTIGTWGLHYAHRIFSRLDFPSDFANVLSENQLFNQRYEFVNEGIGGDWMTQAGLSYGTSVSTQRRWFPLIGVGATAKVLHGIAHFEIGENSILTVDRITTGGGFGFRVRGGYTVRGAEPDGFDPSQTVESFLTGLFPSGAGFGVGVDVGVAGVAYRSSEDGRDLAYYGLALCDLGSIRWSGHTTQRHEEGIDDLIPNATLTNEQFSRYQGTLDTIGPYTTGLPTVVRCAVGLDLSVFGVDHSLAGVLEVEGELPVADVPGNSREARASVGAGVSVNDWLTLRGGLSGWGIDGFGVGLGFGVRPTDWLLIDVGSAEVDAIVAGERVDLAFRLVAGIGAP